MDAEPDERPRPSTHGQHIPHDVARYKPARQARAVMAAGDNPLYIVGDNPLYTTPPPPLRPPLRLRTRRARRATCSARRLRALPPLPLRGAPASATPRAPRRRYARRALRLRSPSPRAGAKHPPRGAGAAAGGRPFACGKLRQICILMSCEIMGGLERGRPLETIRNICRAGVREPAPYLHRPRSFCGKNRASRRGSPAARASPAPSAEGRGRRQTSHVGSALCLRSRSAALRPALRLRDVTRRPRRRPHARVAPLPRLVRLRPRRCPVAHGVR